MEERSPLVELIWLIQIGIILSKEKEHLRNFSGACDEVLRIKPFGIRQHLRVPLQKQFNNIQGGILAS
jgi:hypothetical protein